MHTITRRLLAMISMTLILAMSAFPVFADDVTMHIEGDHVIEKNESIRTGRHTFVLTGENDAPMPEGSTGEVKKVTIDSNQTFDFGDITYTKPGTYTYTVSRETTKSDTLKEDDSEYVCNIAVFSDNTSVMVFSKKGSDGKPDRIKYTDTYSTTPISGNDKVKTGETQDMWGYAFAAALIALILYNVSSARKKATKK